MGKESCWSTFILEAPVRFPVSLLNEGEISVHILKGFKIQSRLFSRSGVKISRVYLVDFPAQGPKSSVVITRVTKQSTRGFSHRRAEAPILLGVPALASRHLVPLPLPLSASRPALLPNTTCQNFKLCHSFISMAALCRGRRALSGVRECE